MKEIKNVIILSFIRLILKLVNILFRIIKNFIQKNENSTCIKNWIQKLDKDNTQESWIFIRNELMKFINYEKNTIKK